MKQMTYINIDRKVLKKKEEEANKKAISEMGDEEGKDSLMFDSENIKEDGCYVSDINGENISITLESDIVYVDLTATLSDEHIIKIVELATKKLNRLKTVMEGLK